MAIRPRISLICCSLSVTGMHVDSDRRYGPLDNRTQLPRYDAICLCGVTTASYEGCDAQGMEWPSGFGRWTDGGPGGPRTMPLLDKPAPLATLCAEASPKKTTARVTTALSRPEQAPINSWHLETGQSDSVFHTRVVTAHGTTPPPRNFQGRVGSEPLRRHRRCGRPDAHSRCGS